MHSNLDAKGDLLRAEQKLDMQLVHICDLLLKIGELRIENQELREQLSVMRIERD